MIVHIEYDVTANDYNFIPAEVLVIKNYENSEVDTEFRRRITEAYNNAVNALNKIASEIHVYEKEQRAKRLSKS